MNSNYDSIIDLVDDIRSQKLQSSSLKRVEFISKISSEIDARIANAAKLIWPTCKEFSPYWMSNTEFNIHHIENAIRYVVESVILRYIDSGRNQQSRCGGFSADLSLDLDVIIIEISFDLGVIFGTV